MNDSTAALDLADLGLRIFPVRGNDKRPSVKDWPNVATSQPEWSFDGLNTGVRCGFTDLEHADGTKLSFFVVDIDVKDGQPGEASWADFCEEHPEVGEAALATVMVGTPSGGYHFWFVTPAGWDPPSNGRPWPGVDIRGEGGYVLAPPSTLRDGDYEWVRDPFDHQVVEAPEALMRALMGPGTGSEPVPNQSLPLSSIVPRGTSDDDPKQWAKDNFSVHDWLVRQGWQPGRRRGDEEQMTRPGKAARDGSSATFHHDSNIVNIYTTTVDPDWEALGFRSRSGVVTLNGFDAWMIENGYRDAADAMREIRRTLMPVSSGPGYRVANPSPASQTGEAGPGPEESHAGDLNLPDEFWESRDWLAQIRQAAHARLLSADAVLGAVITRYATVIPPQYKIPPIVGAASTFDHISILVGRSGAGKSAAMAVARELFAGPQLRKDVVWDVPVPSGEGLVGMFFEYVEETEDGKKVRKNKKVKTAVHFSIDEAMALVSAGKGRQGATIGSVLCTAWSGGNPGQTNASADRNRQGMLPFTFRMSGMAGVQMALGHHLLDDEWVRQGLSGRLVFFAAEDPTIPLDHIDFPEPLDFPIHPTTPNEIEYATEIVAEVREAHHAERTGRVIIDAIDGHQRLVKLKLSGIIALMEGRTHVTVSDWELAGTIARYSRRLRTVMLEHKRKEDADEHHRKAVARGYYRAIEEETLRSDLVRRCKEAVVRAITRHGPMQRSALKDKLNRDLVRDGVLSEALDQLETDGVIHRPKRGEKGGFSLIE